MILSKHWRTIHDIEKSHELRSYLNRYFSLRPRYALFHELRRRGLGQADLVFALLKCAHPLSRSLVEKLVGRPILVGPPCLLRARTYGGPLRDISSLVHPNDSKRIAWIAPKNPRQPSVTYGAHARWKCFRVGRTLEQARSRGATARDIRRALRKGWIRLESHS